MSRVRRTTIVAGLIAAMVLGASPNCMAAVCLDGAVVLGYGETYHDAEGPSAHRGVDVTLAAGEVVPALVEGDVTFAGRVPSSSGGSVMCVTIRSGDDAVTVSPLEQLRVSKGQRVEAGVALGTLAKTGDPSSEGPHLHVSLRRNGVYIDPSPLLSFVPSVSPRTEPAVVEPEDAPVVLQPPPTGAAEPVPAPPVGAQQPAVVIGGGVPEPETNISPGLCADERVAAGQAEQAANPQWESDGAPEYGPCAPVLSRPLVHEVARGAGGAHVARPQVLRSGPVESMRRSLTSWLAEGLASRGGARATSAGRWNDVPSAVGAGGVAPHRAQAPGIRIALEDARARLRGVVQAGGAVALMAAIFGVLYIMSRRMVERGIRSQTPVSDRFGSMLQHLRAGDTLCGLTSCSGLLPSQSRGRLAQRR